MVPKQATETWTPVRDQEDDIPYANGLLASTGLSRVKLLDTAHHLSVEGDEEMIERELLDEIIELPEGRTEDSEALRRAELAQQLAVMRKESGLTQQ